jgi:hypothetical protein
VVTLPTLDQIIEGVTAQADQNPTTLSVLTHFKNNPNDSLRKAAEALGVSKNRIASVKRQYAAAFAPKGV